MYRSLQRLTVGMASILAIFLVCFSAYLQLNTKAEDTVTTEEVLGEVCAGAAEVLELDITPSDEEVEAIVQNNSWKNPGSLVMSNVNDSVNVREAPTTESSRVGLMYSDCAGYIIEYTESWTKLTSGNVEGWVCNDYLLFGDQAKELADEVGVYRATINCSTVNVRMEPSLEAGIYGLVDEGELFEVIDTDGDWLLVDYEGATGYINTSCADIEYHIDTGETLAEIEEREAAERAAKREAERIQYYGVYAAGASDVELLGAIIQCESGNQPYEGQVAVGAVVMNRVRSGAYPNTIYGVVYAAGQFGPAYSGAVDRRIQAGVSASCIQAAQEALSGYSNVGAATHFRPVGSHEGIEIGGHVFW